MEVTVYWWNGDIVESAIALEIRHDSRAGKGLAVIFENDQWNHLEDCYLTERQCLRAQRLPDSPSHKLVKAVIRSVLTLEAITEQLNDALPKAD